MSLLRARQAIAIPQLVIIAGFWVLSFLFSVPLSPPHSLSPSLSLSLARTHANTAGPARVDAKLVPVCLRVRMKFRFKFGVVKSHCCSRIPGTRWGGAVEPDSFSPGEFRCCGSRGPAILAAPLGNSGLSRANSLDQSFLRLYLPDIHLPGTRVSEGGSTGVFSELPPLLFWGGRGLLLAELVPHGRFSRCGRCVSYNFCLVKPPSHAHGWRRCDRREHML